MWSWLAIANSIGGAFKYPWGISISPSLGAACFSASERSSAHHLANGDVMLRNQYIICVRILPLLSYLSGPVYGLHTVLRHVPFESRDSPGAAQSSTEPIVIFAWMPYLIGLP